MPPTPESKVSVGQKIQIKAETWNTLVDVARAYRRDQPTVENPLGINADAGAGLHCLIHNDTGIDLQVYSVLRLTNPVEDIDADPYNAFGGKAVRGTLPSAGNNSVAITQRSLEAGTFGLALFQGITPCKLFLNNASHEYARPVAGNEVYMETTADSGVAKIIWKSTTVVGGLVWALVQLIGPTPAGSALLTHTMDIVTNVQCVAGSLVVTKATYTIKAEGLEITS